MVNFGEWLQTELDNRNWKQADLSRATGLDTAVISNLRNGKRGPGEDTCTAIATAFHLPPEVVFRAAGLLPDLPTPRALYEEIVKHRLSLLDDAQLEDVLKYVD